MIKRQGYYLSDPKQGLDYVGGNPIRFFMYQSYWFVDELHTLSLFLRKETEIEELAKNQFIDPIIICKYYRDENLLKIINRAETKYEVIQEFKIVHQALFEDFEGRPYRYFKFNTQNQQDGSKENT
jgi:hypothetical protein